MMLIIMSVIWFIYYILSLPKHKISKCTKMCMYQTRGSVDWACVARLSIVWGNFIQVLPTKFQLIWPHGFRKDLFKLAISHTRTAYDGYISCMIGMKYGIFVQDLKYTIPAK